MKKKVLATLLVGAMAASLLAGCGTTVETTGSSDTTTAPEKTQTTETAEAGEAGGSDVSADITLYSDRRWTGSSPYHGRTGTSGCKLGSKRIDG